MKNVLKRSLSILLAITIIFSSAYIGLNESDFSGLFVVKAEAANSGTCGDNVIWSFDGDTLTISGSGEMKNYLMFDMPWKSFKSNIKNVVICSGVTRIGHTAFYGCSLESIFIPKSIKSIQVLDFISCDIEYIYYEGSAEEAFEVFANFSGECDDIYFNCKSLGISNLQKVATEGSYTINVKAINTSGTPVNAIGADVTVYLGRERDAKVIHSKDTDSSGNVTFTEIELVSKGISLDDIPNCTVSAHLKFDNGLELCSETIDSNGVWKGTYLRDGLVLTVDEPRIYYDISVGFTAKSEKKRQKKWQELDSVMREFVVKFAQSTNGHALISNYSLTSYETDNLLANSVTDHDIYILDKPKKVLGEDIKTASTNMDNNYMLFKYGNGYFNANTLCHEAGHLFFDFYDEYCYGLGYEYKGVKGDGDWKNRGGKIERPNGAPSNFGLMDYQHDGDIEMSSQEDYSYLKGIKYDSSKPELYTKHYYEYQESTEQTLMGYLNDIAVKEGYSTKYSPSNGKDQTADYWYSRIGSDVYSSSDYIIYDIKSDYATIYEASSDKEFNTLNVDFSFSNNVLIGSFIATESYVLMESVDTGEILDVSTEVNGEKYTFSIPINQEKDFSIYIIENQGGTYTKEIYNVSVSEKTNDVYGEYFLVSITYNEALVLDNIIQNSKVLNILGIGDKNVEHLLSAQFHITENITPQGLSWNIVNENSCKSVDTTVYNGENNVLIYECLCTSDGEYFIPLNDCEYTVSSTISDITLEKDSRYDDMIWVSFKDSNMNDGYYTVYYGKEDTFDPESMASETSDSSSKRIVINLEIGQKYYIYVTYKSLTGEMYVIENPVTYINTYNDADNDGIPDYWLDIYYQLKDLDDIVNTDLDEDGLNNLQEYENGTNPLNPDTDGDNVYDAIEIKKSLNPLEPMTDGETDDYTVVYGRPDLKITYISFDDDYIYFNVGNETDGKAKRTIVNVINNDVSVASWIVDIDSQSTVDLSIDRTLLKSISDLKIEIDDSHITRDIDYSNNVFEYVPATSITLEDVTMVKGSSQELQTIYEPTTISDIFKWSYINGSSNISVDTKTGNISSIGIGQAEIQVETLSGLSADCTVTIIPFEGSGYTEFDCELINDSTEVAITGFIGEVTDVTIPESIGGYPVTQLQSNCIPSGVLNVNIPSTISKIDSGALNCDTLKNITVDAKNKDYVSVDGVLYDAEETSLLKVPKAYSELTFIIPDSVLIIGEGAFADCSVLSKVQIPKSVETIDATAFKDNTNTVIFCDANSIAHTFAIDNNIPFIANNDNTTVDISNNIIKTNLLCKGINEIVAGSESLSFIVDSAYFAGTGAKVDVMKGEALHSQYTLVVESDVNGDGVCDVLDCAQVALVTNSLQTFDGVYEMAADSNSDDIVDINDYQSIVNTCVAS